MTTSTLAGTLHEPITNVVVEEAPATPLISTPTEGTVEVLVPTAAGTEPVAADIRPESAVLPTAPDAEFADVGAASFGADGIVFETVHGADTRVLVDDTTLYPWSATASLLITARDGSQWVGTAWFIGPRTLATAGHCVYITNSPIAARNGWVLSIQVMPGRNGTQLPFGSVTATQLWTVRGWADSGDENYDYGAIVLPTDLGNQVGTFGFGVYEDVALADRVVNIGGYPADKAPGTLWYDTHELASTSASKLFYDIDTAGGQSGAAVYLVDDGRRIATGVHAYGGPVTNSATRVSTPVYENLSAWKG